MAQNQLNFKINFDVNQSGIAYAKKSLEQLRNISKKDLEIVYHVDSSQIDRTFNEIARQSNIVEEALENAFNPRLNTINFQRFNQELQNSGTSINQIRGLCQNLGEVGNKAFTEMTAGITDVKYQTVQTTTLLDKMAASLRRNLTVFVSMNIINKVKGSINEAYGYIKNLDTSLNEIRIVTGKSADEMDRFAESANKAAAKLGKATTDYTKASTIFYQQGLSDEEVQARTEVTLKASNTTGEDTKKVADQLTSMWNGFNVEAEDAEKAVDIVAAVAKTTASNLDEMATAMSKVASLANSMGVSEEQLASQISTVISVTRQAPESVGTAFKTIYARIADIKVGSEDAEISLGNYSGQLAALGINVLDADGHLKDMGQTIEEVGASWKNYSKEQQVAIAGIMGGQRQVNQIRALFDNWDKYTQTMKVAAEAEGTLQEEQDIFMESSEGQLQKLRTNWEGVLDSILSSEDIIKVAKSLQPVLESIEKIIDTFGGGIGILNGLLPVLYQLVAPQISAGIAKIGMSFDASRNNAELARNEIKGLRTLLDSNFNTPGLESYQQQLNALIEDYARLRDTMTVSQRNEFRESLKSIIAHEGPEVIKVLNEINRQKNELSQKDTNLLDSSNLATLLNNNDNIGLNSTRQEILEISETLNNFIQNGVKPTEQEFDELAQRLRSTFGESDTVENFVQDWENSLKLLKSGIQDFRRDFVTQLMSEDGFDTTFLDNLRAKFAEVFGEGSEEIERLDILISQIGNNQNIKNELEQTDVRLSQISEEINNIINQRRAATREAKAAVQEQINAIESELIAAEQHFRSSQEAYPGDTDVDNSILEEASDRLRAAQAEAGRLEELYRDLNELNTKLEEAEGSFQHRESVIKYTGIDYEGLVSQQNALRRESADIIRQQSELNTVLEGSEQEIANLAVTTDEAMNAEQNFNNVTGQMVGNLDAVVEDTAEVSEGLQRLGNTGYETAQSINNINLSFREIDAQRLAQGITAIGQGFTTVVTGIMQLKNLGQIWNNEDLELGEKLLRTLTSLGMVLTTSAMAINLFRNEQTQLAIAEIAGTVVDNVRTLALRLYTKAADGATRATLSLKAVTAITFAVITAIIAAVVVAVYAFVKATETSEKKLEKANKKLEEATNKYNELKRALEDYAQAEEGLAKLEKGTKEFTNAISDLNQKILDLIATYPELRKYLTIGDSGEFKLSKEGLEEYVKLQEDQLKIQQREVLGVGITTFGDKEKQKRLSNRAAGGFLTQANNNWFSDLVLYITGGPLNKIQEQLEEKTEQANFVYSKWLEQSQEADKKVLTGYLKSYEEFAETSANITAAVVNDVYEENGRNGKKAKKELDNVIAMQERAEQYKKKAEIFKNKGFNFSDADLKNKDYSNVSKYDIYQLLRTDDNELALMLDVDINTEKGKQDIQDFKNNLSEAWQEMKKLPSPLQGWIGEDAIHTGLDLGIVKMFEKDVGIVKDEILVDLGKYLNEDIVDESLLNKLTSADWSQGNQSLEDFKESLKEIGINYDSLDNRVKEYVKAQIEANTIWNKASSSLAKLSSAAGKVSTLKFGDMLSDKDYSELISKFEGLSKYFQKVGEKWQYTAKSNSKVFAEMKAEYYNARTELSKFSQSLEDKDFSDLRKDDTKLKRAQSFLKEQINNGTITAQTLASFGGMTETDVQKLLDGTNLSENQIGSLENMFTTFANDQAAAFENDVEMIYATIQSEEELERAVQDLGVSEEAVEAAREPIHQKTIERLEEQRQKTLDLIKADEEYQRSQIQNKRSKIEKKMESAEGNEWVKLYKERQKLIKEEEASLRRQQAAQLVLLNQHKADLETRITEVATEEELKEIDLTRITDMIKEGSSWKEIEGIIGKTLNKNSDTYNTIQQQYELINGEARELEQIIKDTNDLIEEQVVKIDRENSGLSDSLEVQKNATQRRISKTEDRMAHATGQEWLDLYKERQGEKNQYKSILNTEYTNSGVAMANRKTELEGIKDYTGNITFDANGLAILKEDKEVSQDLVTAAQNYNNAIKERISLEYEIDDLDKKQYITIGKTVDEQRALNNTQRELNKLTKEADFLSGDALVKNLEKQRELRQQNLDLQIKQLEESKKEKEDAKTKFEGILLNNGFTQDQINALIQYDDYGGIANKEDIFKDARISGSTFAEELNTIIDEFNDCADATQELEDAFLDFAEKLDSNYDEENQIKGLQRQKDILETQRNNMEKGSPEYEAVSKQIQDINKNIRDLKQKELEDYQNDELSQADTTLREALADTTLTWEPKYDENNIITNVGDLQNEITSEDWEKISKISELDKKELEELKAKYGGDIKALQEAILSYNEKRNAALDQENNIAKENITKWNEERQLRKDIHDWTQKNLQEEKSILELEGNGLYGDNKVTNLEKQAQIQHQITEDAKQQVLEQEAYIETLKKESADESIILQAETDLRDYKKSALEAEKKEQDEIKKILQEKVKVSEEAIKRETTAQHQLKNALKETDRALTKIKKDQEGLSGNALVAKMQEEVALQGQKKKILEQQLAVIKQQIQALVAMYSLEFSKQFKVPISFVVDENGVSNLDDIESALNKVEDKDQALAREMANSWTSTLNSLASNWSSLQSSIDGMSDSIDSLNKKIKETAEAEKFRVKEEKWDYLEAKLKLINKELERLQRLQKHLTGEALIKNLTQQQKLLEKQAQAQANKLAAMKAELQIMQQLLAAEGVAFDSDGLVSNFAYIFAQGNEKLNGYIKSYQSLYDTVQDLESSIAETYDKQLDLEYEKAAERLRLFNAKIDVELDLGKAKREWQNFKREFLNTLNDMQALNDSLVEKAKQGVREMIDMSAREAPMLTDHVNQIMSEIHLMQAGGWSNLYGTDQEAALSDLANYRQQLQDTLSSISDKIKEVNDSYLQQIEKIQSKFDEQIGNYEQIQSIIEHDMNLIKFLHGDKAYEELANYYDKSTKNYEAQLKDQKYQVEYWKRLMDSAQPDSEAWNKFQENWKNAVSKLNSTVDSALENLLKKYENAINSIANRLENKITNGNGFDWNKQKWDWDKEERQLYLDDIGKAYNIEKLRYKYQKAANEATNPNKQAKVLKIMDEELGKLKAKDKLTKYEVERAEKVYELKMKQLELEDAANNKTKMRLRRDTEGNYRYEYVADEDKIAELKQEILDLQEEIRQFDLSTYEQAVEEMYAKSAEAIEKIKELAMQKAQGLITDEEFNQRYAELVDHYGQVIGQLEDLYDISTTNLTNSSLDELVMLGEKTKEEISALTDFQKTKMTEEWYQTYNQTVSNVADALKTFTNNLNDMMIDVKAELDNYVLGLQSMESAAGISFETVIDGIDTNIDAMDVLIEQNDELLLKYEQELQAIEELIHELDGLEDAYMGVYDAAMQAVDAALELRRTEMDYDDSGNVNGTGAAAASGGAQINSSPSTSNVISPSKASITGTKTKQSKSQGVYHVYYKDDNSPYKIDTKIPEKGYTPMGPPFNTVAEARAWWVEMKKNIIDIATGAGIASGATGMYTGEWGSEGKLAVLHEKELVLNKTDTANILEAVKAMRQGSSANNYTVQAIQSLADSVNRLQDNVASLLDIASTSLLSSAAAASTISNTSSSSVTNNINANFPNAGNMNEIQNALMNLPNYTSQKLHSNQRGKSGTANASTLRTKSF